ncbi:putative leucine-rich repeat-containing protein DDB_G0290503 isoform X1, partial [Tachysurus ichikawai]
MNKEKFTSHDIPVLFKDKKEEVLGLTSELDDSNLAKIVLKNLVLLSDQTHLQRLISDIREKADKQIA